MVTFTLHIHHIIAILCITGGLLLGFALAYIDKGKDNE